MTAVVAATAALLALCKFRGLIIFQLRFVTKFNKIFGPATGQFDGPKL
jgi:hypothetical protein